MSFFRRLTDERGVALPVALAVLFTVAGLATVAARAAIVSQNQSFRDNNVKRAVQAANAGLQAAIYQTNLMQPSSTQCVHKDASTGALTNAALQADNWCAAQSEDLGDGADLQLPGLRSHADDLPAPVCSWISVRSISFGDRERRTPAGCGHDQRRARRPGLPARLRRRGARLHQNDEQRGHLRSPRLERNDHCQEQPRCLRQRHARARARPPSIGQNFTQCPGYNTNPASGAARPSAGGHDARRPRMTTTRLTNMKAGSGPPQDTCSNCSKVAWSASTRVLTIENRGRLEPERQRLPVLPPGFQERDDSDRQPHDAAVHLHRQPPELREHHRHGLGRHGRHVHEPLFAAPCDRDHGRRERHEGDQRRPPDEQRDQPDRRLRAQLDGGA